MTYDAKIPQLYTNTFVATYTLINDKDHHLSNRQKAQNMVRQWFNGWKIVDCQYDGHDFKVHARDSNGTYKTVYIDSRYKYERTKTGYR
jgi:hypothetical protein